MNFLAHIYLSGDSDLIKIGNFMADGVRGPGRSGEAARVHPRGERTELRPARSGAGRRVSGLLVFLLGPGKVVEDELLDLVAP